MIFQAEGILRQPLLYLSLYFKQHRSRYYELLQSVRREGDWEEWITFFLEGVISVATQAATTAHQLLALFQEHQLQIRSLGRLKHDDAKWKNIPSAEQQSIVQKEHEQPKTIRPPQHMKNPTKIEKTKKIFKSQM